MNYIKYKSVIIIVIILISNKVFSQKNEGIAIYTKSYIENPEAKESYMSKQMKSMKAEFASLKFNLKFTKDESIFEVEESINLEDNMLANLALTVGGSKGVFYTNTKDKNILNEKESFGQEFIVKRSLESIKWKLHNKTKKIGNYLCYKAMTTYVVINSKGIFNHSVTAWYTTEIPVGFGPIGYGGLPGLIVELSVQNFKYQMEQIIFNPKKQFKIKKPTNGKQVTEKEFNAIGKEAMGNFKSKISN
ncbi:GLPGLI family protein [Lutibacter sp.]